MHTYIVFLRGINVSGQKQIKMAELKKHLQEIGLPYVQTYIQSGNLMVKTGQEASDLKLQLVDTIKNIYGYDVEVIVKTPDDIEKILAENPFTDKPTDKLYFTLLNSLPSAEQLTILNDVDYSPEQFRAQDEVIYIYAANGYGRAKLNNNFFEKKLKVAATTRNYKTMNKMLEMS